MTQLPSSSQLRKELAREIVRSDIRKKALLIGSVVLGFLFLCVLFHASSLYKVTDSDMIPTLKEKDLLVRKKAKNLKAGDLVIVEYEGETTIRRVVAVGNDKIDIDRNGNLYVNNQYMEEAYLSEKALGLCDLDLPYQVPEGQFFLLADERSGAADSRQQIFGCLTLKEIKGKVTFRIWPWKEFGSLKARQEQSADDDTES